MPVRDTGAEMKAEKQAEKADDVFDYIGEEEGIFTEETTN
jgi:hypothetical protein